MDEAALIPEEIRNKIGQEWATQEYEIEKGELRRFARAVGDPNPLWQDEDYARKTRYGGTIAPPTFAITIGSEQFLEILDKFSTRTVLLGNTELECYQPVKPGDRITVVTRIANIRERQGRMGKMAFMYLETAYKNPQSDLVAKCQQTLIIY